MGTRLSAIIHLRDKFGNACAWLDDDDDEDVDPNRGANDIQYQLRNDIRNQLTATILQRGIALSATETKPNKLGIDPRDESLGVYEAKHVLARAGRFVITIQLNGNETTKGLATRTTGSLACAVQLAPAAKLTRLEMAVVQTRR